MPFLLDRDNFVDHQSPPPAVPVPKKQCLDNGGSGGLGSVPQMAGPTRDIDMVHPLLLSYALCVISDSMVVSNTHTHTLYIYYLTYIVMI